MAIRYAFVVALVLSATSLARSADLPPGATLLDPDIVWDLEPDLDPSPGTRDTVFTVSPDDGRRLLSTNPCGIPLARLGEIIPGAGCQLRGPDGKLTPLPALGWKHEFEKPR